PDGLVRREEHRDRRRYRTGQRHRADVGALGEPETAVLARDLDPEGAEPVQPLDHVLGEPAVGLDGLGVHLLRQEATELLEEGASTRLLPGVGGWVRVDEIEAQLPEEELAHEARPRPFGLPGRLRHGAGLRLRNPGAGRAACVVRRRLRAHTLTSGWR